VLAQVTSSQNAPKDPLTVSARRRVVQQGFVDCFLKRALEFGYRVCDDVTEIADGANANEQSMSLLMGEVEMTQLVGNCTEISAILDQTTFDDVERLPNGNMFVENTFKLVANVTELAENLSVLMSDKSLMIS